MTTLDINNCLWRKLETTNRNYLNFTRAIGALLRTDDGAVPKTLPTRIPFDDAEQTWHQYREQACKVATDRFEGGTIAPSINLGCQIDLTQHHMVELGEIYSDLGTD